MMDKIRILIADDHAIVREGLRALISIHPEMELIGEAADGVEAVVRALELQPDVVLLDLMMPRKNGIDCIQEIKQNRPDAHILVLTSFSDDNLVFSAIKAGALGYLLKDSLPSELIQAIQDVHQGRPSLHPTIALKLIDELNRPVEAPLTDNPLTPREMEILKLVAQGLSNQQIGEKLVISERTVRRHVSNILEKLHFANRTQVALYALREGVANLDKES